MPPSLPRRRTFALVIACGVAVACTSSGPSSPTTYFVRYSVGATTGVIFDSVTYDDGQGASVRVLAPTSTWFEVLTLGNGGTVEAHAWGRTPGAGSADLRVSWTVQGVSTALDSTKAVMSAPGAFNLSLPRRTLP